MNRLDLKIFSKTYSIKELTSDDVEMIFSFCKSNTQYYEYCGKDISVELIENDIHALPPETDKDQKYYVGFFENDKFIALLDLICGYPNKEDAFIGFFMMSHELQGKGLGSKIISELLEYLKIQGFKKCQLGIDKENPQSNHFWKKNGFETVREVAVDGHPILVAEKQL